VGDDRASAHTSSMESISTVSDEPLLPESASPPPPRHLTRLRSHRVLLVVRSAAKMKKSGEAKGGLAAKGAQQRTFLSGSYRMLTNNPVYLMLVFVPPALLSALLGMSDGAVFALSCCAILPLAGLLGDATEQVALHTNETLSGLLNATFGNATELIVAIFALQKGMLTVVQVTLLGSILSNTLLVLGCACLAGGLTAQKSTFNKVAAVSNAALLQIAVLGLEIPTLLFYVNNDQRPDIHLSRGISAGLLVLYCLYIFFQLHTHKDFFDAPSASDQSLSLSRGHGLDKEGEEEEEEEVLLSLWGAVSWLGMATVLIAFISEALTGTLEGAAHGWGLSEAFVGFCLVPIVGNAAE